MVFKRKEDTLSRAEQVRRRRQQRASASAAPRRTRRAKAKNRPQQKAQAVAAASPTPVVVSRYGVVGEAALPPTGHVRRQVRIPSGRYTEMVTALPMLSLGWRAFSLALSLLVIVILAALWYAPTFRASVPEVQGTHYLDAGQVAARLGVQGRPVVVLAPAVLARQLEALPAVARARVTVAFPNRVVVTLEERQPVLVWVNGHKQWWVAADGVAFPPLAEQPPQGVVTVEADGLPDDAVETRPGVMQMLSPEQVQSLRTLGRYLPAGTPLVYSRRYGLGWRAEQGWQVFVGRSLTQMDKRMKLYQAIAAWLQAQGLKPALVNVASLQAPYYRMEP